MVSFDDIPLEIIRSHLAPQISSSDLLALTFVNIHHYNCLRFDNSLWFSKFKQLFKDRSSQSLCFDQVSDWYKFFIARRYAKLWTWGTGSLGYSSREIENSSNVTCSSVPRLVDRISPGVVITDLAVTGKCGTKFAFLTEDGDGYISFKKFLADEFSNTDLIITNKWKEVQQRMKLSGKTFKKEFVECSSEFLAKLVLDDGSKLIRLYSSATSPFLIALTDKHDFYIWDVTADVLTPLKLKLVYDDEHGNTVQIKSKNVVKFSLDRSIVVFKYNNSLFGFKNTDIEMSIELNEETFSSFNKDNSKDIIICAKAKCKMYNSVHENFEDFTIHDNICLYTRPDGRMYYYSLLTSSRKLCPVGADCIFDQLYTSCSITTVIKKTSDDDITYHNTLNDRPIVSNLQFIGFARGPSHFLCFDENGGMYSFGSDDAELGYLGIGDLEYSHDFCSPVQIDIPGKCVAVEAGSVFSCALISSPHRL